MFKLNKFKIAQYKLLKKGRDKLAPEFYWGYQPYSKII